MTYIYVCDPCKIKYEKTHGMNETPTYKCKKCHKKLRRVITGGSGVIYRGDGWSHAGKKDKNYNRDRKMESIREHPETDPYSGYRNWNEEK